ncbi:MAG: YlxM family DNA-binding protein [Oscillospiraceae bacterium]
MKDLKISLFLDIYGKLLTSTQYDMVDLYYNEDLSLSEIAEHFSISRQGVRDAIKRGETILKDFDEKLLISHKNKIIETSVLKIKTIFLEIERQCNIQGYRKDNILQSIDEIKKELEKIK